MFFQILSGAVPHLPITKSRRWDVSFNFTLRLFPFGINCNFLWKLHLLVLIIHEFN
jgi:hypothetical protein